MQVLEVHQQEVAALVQGGVALLEATEAQAW